MTVMTGTTGPDSISGTDGNDELHGLEGDDLINGRRGADAMHGGAGNDVFVVNEGGDLVVELVGEGTDEIRAAVSYALPDNVENLTLTGEAIEASGNALSNRIAGNAGANVIRGGGGSDVFRGLAGDDTYYVEARVERNADGSLTFIGVDQVLEAAGDGVDHVVSNASYRLGENVEHLTLTGAFDLSGFGNAASNRLTGNSGRNFLSGGEGNDWLNGRAGTDTMEGGDGDDTYVVDNAGDRLGTESPFEHGGHDTVRSAIAFTLDVSFEDLVLTGAQAVDGTGNHAGNRITGNGAANVLAGLGGNDALLGGGGNDSLDGGFGDDWLRGGTGDDLLEGGAGEDRLDGGLGDDTYIVRDSQDDVREAADAGTDTVVVAADYRLGDNVENLTLTGNFDFGGTGNALGNTLIGNEGSNDLFGLDGADFIAGGHGDDTIAGGRGRDRMRGDQGADTYVFADGHFAAMTLAGADRVVGFDGAEGDRIDLAAVDADSAAEGDQAFVYIGDAAFSGAAGELRYEVVSGNRYVMGDTDGNGAADFWVRLDGEAALLSADFVL